MSSIETGGPAFPCDRVFNPNTGGIVISDGMTLHDYFAAKAIPFIQWNKDNTELCAKRCYEMADAMLKARNQS
jgi:hypothetical protein